MCVRVRDVNEARTLEAEAEAMAEFIQFWPSEFYKFRRRKLHGLELGLEGPGLGLEGPGLGLEGPGLGLGLCLGLEGQSSSRPRSR